MITAEALNAALPVVYAVVLLASVVMMGFGSIILLQNGHWIGGSFVGVLTLLTVFLILVIAQQAFGWENFPIIYDTKEG